MASRARIRRGEVRVGCCGFAMARARYFDRFPIVEVQQTFYDPPRTATLERWREEAPRGFEFTLKAWQLITHPATSPTYRRLRHPLPEGWRGQVGGFRDSEAVREAWHRSLEAARALRAGVIVFQCPASLAPTPETLRRLERFFRRARSEAEEILLAWEPRGDWPRGLVAELCRELDLLAVVDPFQQPSPLPERPRYFRLHGIGGLSHRYSDDELGQLVAWCREGPGPTRCLFNNRWMAEDAARLIALLARGR